ncbi:MAG: tail fiber protein [Acetobacteraceae bacterium]|nr:tail fiber protein [Acetobacteraceae bacterium]
MAQPFLGQITVFPFNFAPVGWMTCSGQLLPISQYAALFSLLGTNYGGNGTSNFALPDLQGRVPLNQGQGPGLSDYVIGEAAGDETVQLTGSTMPGHSHSLGATTTHGSTNEPAGKLLSTVQTGGLAGGDKGLIYSASAPDTALSPGSIAAAGGNQPHANMQPYLALTYCIAMTGVFPSRP